MGRPPNARSTGDTIPATLTIRMYRVSVGDCFLVTFRQGDAAPFRMLIDCGIHQSKSGGSDIIRRAVQDIVEETGGILDLLVVTHEHADHISGFRLARRHFLTDAQDKKLDVRETWFAWTEDDRDPFARDLIRKRRRAVRALTRANARMRMLGLAGADNPLEGLLGFMEPPAPDDDQDGGAGQGLGFMGGGAGSHSIQAFETIKTISRAIRYRTPGETPFEIPCIDARIFVLGPPRDKELIKRSDPGRNGDEVYHFGAYGDALAAIEPAFDVHADRPFDDSVTLPLEASRSIGFFQNHYWLDCCPGPIEAGKEATTQGWRRIGHDWLNAATSLALKLDHDTNNTSLVLAVELGKKDENGPVVLFAADAQVGNWLSWQDVAWDDCHGRRVTGPDLLARTIVYKTGHHGSHNATLREKGLELMDALELALVPTDRAMAETVKWGDFPLPSLMERLREKTAGRVIRSDRSLPEATGRFSFRESDLFYEVTF